MKSVDIHPDEVASIELGDDEYIIMFNTDRESQLVPYTKQTVLSLVLLSKLDIEVSADI